MARRDEREGLSGLNNLHEYEVADGEPDPRGWEVFASDGVKVGRIEDLLVDTGEMRVRAIDLIIDQRALNLPEGDNHLYIPIRSVSLDEGAQRAVVPGLRSDQVATMRGRRDFEAFDSSMRETGIREAGAGETRTGGTTIGRTTGGTTTGRTTRETTGFQTGARPAETSETRSEHIRVSRGRSDTSRSDIGRDESERGRP